VTDGLMAGDDWRFLGRKFAFDDVEVGAADAAHFDADKNFTGGGLGLGEFAKFEGIGRDACGCAEGTGLHKTTSKLISSAHLRKAANTRVRKTIHKLGAERKGECGLGSGSASGEPTYLAQNPSGSFFRELSGLILATKCSEPHLRSRV